MIENNDQSKVRRAPKKITPQRLKNIALYYLKRFDSSVENLRQVLRRRVNDYAYHNPEWKKEEAYTWIEDLLADFLRYGYLDDARYAENKIKNYIISGKSARYIAGKLKQKGISPVAVEDVLIEQNYDPFATALHYAQKKKIGPFRAAEDRENFRQKDLGGLVRAGFDYDIALQVLSYEV
ncbi:MAG: regulatory protein RecX [Alphaproteobacteria bacterium]|nr:regulatory protein RecX [Alphaproteobacteria bacterium]